MPWWAWCLVIVGGGILLSLAFVVYLAALFSKGDNPEGKWRLW